MAKKRSKKFWVIFWSLAVIFWVSLYFFLQFRNDKMQMITKTIDFLPFGLEEKEEYKFIAYFADYLLKKDDQEKVFLVLFQNDMELRPGGGYIGSFGILKVKNGEILEIGTHDLSNFDARIPDTQEPPYPMKEMLHIGSWKLRDSNWSPDFSENAKKAQYFYEMGKGEEKFDGIVAINSKVLTSFLSVTGPVTLPSYPGTYDSENAILTLEYQVEKGYAKQGLEIGERKSVMNELAQEISQKIKTLDNSKKIDLAKMILNDLNNKNIQLFFKDQTLQFQTQKAGWSGEMKKNWNNDYLMIVDANLGALKSDYYIKRNYSYTVDFSKERPEARLKIIYNHTAKEKDWMTKEYLSYLRVYVPANSWLFDSKNLGEIRFGNELEKKYFASIITVPIGQTKTVELDYYLSENINEENYDLFFQKQSGLGNVPVGISVISKTGENKNFPITLQNEWEMKK